MNKHNCTGWTESEEKVVRELRQQSYTIEYIAQKLKRPYKSVAMKCHRLGFTEEIPIKSGRLTDFGRIKQRRISLDDFDYVKYTNFLDIHRPSALVISDTHLPNIHLQYWDYTKRLAKIRKIKTLVVAGDLANQNAFSYFISASSRGSYRREQNIVNAFFNECYDIFEDIYLIAGNHDMRFFKILMGEVDYPDWLKMTTDRLNKQIFISGNFRYMNFNGWRITHPKNYSKISTRVAESIAVKLQMHIASGHGHHQGFRYDPSAKLICADTGCMINPEQEEYTATVDTTHPFWNIGFMILDGKYPELFGRHTNWEKVLK